MTRIDSALRYEAQFLARRLEQTNPDIRTALKNYVTSNDSNEHLCPKCWLTSFNNNPVHSIPSDSEDDILRCGVCGTDFVVPG